MVLDLTDGISAIGSGSATAGVELFVSSGTTTSATLTSVDVHVDLDGDGVFQTSVSTDPTVTVAPNTWGYASALLPSGPVHTLTVTATATPTLVAREGHDGIKRDGR